MLQVLLRHRWLLALSGAAVVVESGLSLLYPYLSRYQINALEGKLDAPLINPRDPTTLFLVVVGLILSANLISTLLGGLGRLVDTLLRERLVIDADRVLYDKLEQMDAGFLENPKNRKLVYSFFDVSVLPISLLEFSRTAIRILISVVGIVPIIAVVDLRLCLIMAGTGVVQLALLRHRMRRENAYRLYKEKSMAGINEMIFLLRYHFHQVLGASGERRIMPRFWDRRRQAVQLELTQTRIAVRYDLVSHLLEHLTLFATTILIGLGVLRGKMGIGSFVMVTLYAAQLQASLTGINLSLGEWYRLQSIFVQLGFFLSMKPRVDVSAARAPEEPPWSPECGAPAGARSPTEPLLGDVTLQQVEFHYPGLHHDEKAYIEHLIQVLDLTNRRREVWPGDFDLVREWKALLAQHQDPFPPVLRGLSCCFPRGQITALVGRNGSGKSTMMKLLVRSYDPDAGSIAVAGEALHTLDPRYVRQLFSLVTQTPFVLDSFSIRDNLLLGCPGEPAEPEVWDVLDQLDLRTAVEHAPGRLAGIIGDEVSLSGGQSQLLVLARTILQRRPFILLDEGTNQLDAEHELRILQMLRQLRAQCTIVVITHRMTTARKADNILVLDGGQIVEQGTHEELVARDKGLYRHFWNIQVVD